MDSYQFIPVAALQRDFTPRAPIGIDESAIEIRSPAPQERPVICVSEFGATPDQSDNHTAFMHAIDAARAAQAGILNIPSGIYHFRTSQPISIQGMTNLLVQGNDAELIFARPDGLAHFIEIRDCDTIRIENLILDWDWEEQPLATLAHVHDVDAEGAYVDFFLLDADRRRFPNGQMMVKSLDPLHPEHHTVGYEGAREIPWWIFSDRAQHGHPQHEWIDDRIVRLTPMNDSYRATLSTNARSGDYVRIRHYVQERHGVAMRDNRHLTLSNITVYSCPGHAFVTAGQQQYWQLLNCNVIRRPGTARSITCTGDHYHISNSRGYFKVIGCTFSLGGDDGINIHDNISMGFTRLGPDTLRLHAVRDWRNPFAPGDPVEFRHPDFSPIGFLAHIKKVGAYTADHTLDVTFDRPVPGSIPTHSILMNLTYNSSIYVVRDNVFREHRARGILIGAGNGIIEDNHFYRNDMSAMHVTSGSDQRWAEGHGVTNLIVRNNRFEESPMRDSGRGDRATIEIHTYLPDGPTSFPLHDDIHFISNEFRNVRGPLLSIISAGTIQFTDNQIIATAPLPQGIRHQGNLRVDRAQAVSLRHNRWSGYPDPFEPGVFLHRDTVATLFFFSSPANTLRWMN